MLEELESPRDKLLRKALKILRELPTDGLIPFEFGHALADAYQSEKSRREEAIEKAANYEMDLHQARSEWQEEKKRALEAESEIARLKAELDASRCLGCATPKLGEHHPDCEFNILKREYLEICDLVQKLLIRTGPRH